MREDLKHTTAVEVRRLETLTVALEGGGNPPPLDVEHALESGFACLISLEAELQRAGTDDAELVSGIVALEASLTTLRALTESQPASWRTLGFVLPRAFRRADTELQTQPPARG